MKMKLLRENYIIRTKEKKERFQSDVMIVKLSEEEAIRQLEELANDLEKIELSSEEEKINVFGAVGMATQEVKHSAFLAWLLNPSMPHKLGSAFLKEFLFAVKTYENKHKDIGVKENEEIFDETDLEIFLEDKNLEVKTEKVITNPESRIDIFIHSDKAKVTVAVENKVFTGTHDDQLVRYEKETAVYDGKKIFIYLTPKGDIPTNENGSYNDKWCIVDYATVIEIIKDFAKKEAKKKDAKLRYLMEDYMELVETNILKSNPKVRDKCKEIIRKHAKALEIIGAYKDNVDEVFEFATSWLMENLPNISSTYKTGRKFLFCTKPVEEYFETNGQELKISKELFAFSAGLSAKDGPIKFQISLIKKGDQWGKVESEIHNIVAPGKSMGDKYCTLYGVVLLSEEERQLNFEDVKSQIVDRLQVAVCKIKELETKLN